jgi:hypothetical protein
MGYSSDRRNMVSNKKHVVPKNRRNPLTSWSANHVNISRHDINVNDANWKKAFEKWFKAQKNNSAVKYVKSHNNVIWER